MSQMRSVGPNRGISGSCFSLFTPHSSLLTIALCIGLLFALTGCGGSLSKAQVDRIKLGMTVADVEGILGKGKSVESGEVKQLLQSSAGEEGAKVEFDMSEFRGIRWGDDKKSVVVVFRGDRVFRRFPKGFDK
jgi:hypothetical protein